MQEDGIPPMSSSCFITSNRTHALQWRHKGHGSVSNHQPHDCLLDRSFRRRSKKISKLRVTGLCAGNSPGTGEFPPQMASNAENVSIWWRHHDADDYTIYKVVQALSRNDDFNYISVNHIGAIWELGPQDRAQMLTYKMSWDLVSHLNNCIWSTKIEYKYSKPLTAVAS